MDIPKFLAETINKPENIPNLLQILIKREKYNFASLFLKQNNITYELVDHIYSDSNSTTTDIPQFDPIKQSHQIFISNTGTKDLGGYKSSSGTIKNIIIIPITISNDIIGVLCLGNKSTDILNTDPDNFKDILGLLQLILNKYKIVEEYKKIHSDSTYFSKDLFLANLSHEIRTPLNGIIGYIQLLLATNVNDKQKNYLNSVSTCSLQLLQIINDIIDFSKLASGNMKISKECFSLQEVIDKIFITMKGNIHQKKHSYQVFIDKKIPSYIILDKGKFIQIIINLLSNAINYTPIEGKIGLYITNNKNILSVKICDNGIGISEQDQYKLFNSFTQIRNSLIKKGTGLGLAISKRLVDLLEGTIKVKSERGKGSEFTFTCKHDCIKTFEKNMFLKAEHLSKKIVLIVDDLSSNRMYLSDLIFQWKMEPIVCASGQEALKLIEAKRYNFAVGLIDICMPEINGVDLSHKIKRLNPHIPLIALSSVTGYLDLLNFDVKLDKPINKIQLFDSIYKLINKDYPEQKTSFKRSKNIPILIAEDIIYNQNLLLDMLKVLGYNNIDVANDGLETIQKIKKSHESKTPYKILLLDLRMPNINGYEVIEYIIKNKLPLPKIAVVTASVLGEDKKKCESLGIKYFIPKPIDLNYLKITLSKLISEFG